MACPVALSYHANLQDTRINFHIVSIEWAGCRWDMENVKNRADIRFSSYDIDSILYGRNSIKIMSERI